MKVVVSKHSTLEPGFKGLQFQGTPARHCHVCHVCQSVIWCENLRCLNGVYIRILFLQCKNDKFFMNLFYTASSTKNTFCWDLVPFQTYPWAHYLNIVDQLREGETLLQGQHSKNPWCKPKDNLKRQSKYSKQHMKTCLPDRVVKPSVCQMTGVVYLDLDCC